LQSFVLTEDDVGWGPNNTFVFPAEGGTGEIYRRLATRLGTDRISYGRDVIQVDPALKVVRFADGTEESYDVLISTVPLDLLIQSMTESPAVVRAAADKLQHTGVFMVGVGYETPLADDKSWMYFPQDHTPFYRATNFAKYSPANVPEQDVKRYCSYMTETSYSAHKTEDRSDLESRVEVGLRSARVVEGKPKVASSHLVDIKYAYPVPTLDRDEALSTIQPWLMDQGIFSRGRFGSWLYEIGNMDHAVKMGVDIARRLVEGVREEAWSSTRKADE